MFTILNLLHKLCVTMKEHPGSSHCLHVRCWNVRSLVKMDGGVKTATVRPRGHLVSIDKKVNFLVQELRCFHMGVVCISETKWFGDDAYDVDGFTVLHSGHSVPQFNDTIQHGEGVAIVLDPFFASAWKDSGGV